MLNIAFPFGILMSENYTQRKKIYHGIWEIFTVWEQKLTIFVDVLREKTAYAQLGYHTRKSRKT